MSGEICDLIAQHIKEHEKSTRVSPDKPLTFGERVNYGYGFEDGWRAREPKADHGKGAKRMTAYMVKAAGVLQHGTLADESDKSEIQFLEICDDQEIDHVTSYRVVKVKIEEVSE